MSEDQDQGQNEDLKGLRQAADEGRKAKVEAEQAKRELAFVKAGVDTDTKLGQLLLKTYEGDLTAEAIKAEAMEIGAIKTEAPAPPTTPASLDEQTQSRERQGLAQEPDVQTDQGQDPYQVAHKGFEEKMAKGMTRERAAGEWGLEILRAARAGDPRVIVPR